MNAKDNIIRGLQNRIEEQDRRIKELESELYKTRLGGLGITASHQEIIEQADQDRQDQEARYEALQEQLNIRQRLLDQVIPQPITSPIGRAESASAVLNPPEGEPPRLLALSPEIKQELISRHHIVWDFDESCVVGVTLTIRDSIDQRFEFISWWQVFPGKNADVRKELIPRFQALLARAPMIEAFSSSGLPDIKPEILSAALLELAQFLYLHSLPHHQIVKWAHKVGEVFDALIWPQLLKANYCEPDKTLYRNYFLTAINRTFDKTPRGTESKEARRSNRRKQPN